MSTHPFSTALILAGCLHATVKLYRCTHLQEQLTQLGLQAEVQEWSDQPFSADTARRYDLLILQRTAISGNLNHLIDQLHGAGKTVIFDTDDLIFEPTMTAWHRGVARLSPAEQVEYEQGVRRNLATLTASDAVLTATPLLAELARRHGKPAFVHRNAVGEAMQTLGDRLYAQRQRSLAGQPPRLGRKVIIGYGSGTPTHDVDFDQLTPALLEILARHPEVELWVMGPLILPPELALFGNRIQRQPLLAWPDYLNLAAGLDIFLAPLERANLFCRAKSEIKFVEAGLLGIPTVAARIDPFEHAIQSGVNGLLAGNTAEWIEVLSALITQPDLRHSLGQAARRTVDEQYSPAARTADLAALLPQLAAALTNRPAPESPGESTTRLLTVASSQTALPVVAASHPSAPESTPLVLNWIVSEPFVGSGGHLGIFRMIGHLVEFGHECHIYIVPLEQMHNWSAEEVERFVAIHFLQTGARFHRWAGRVYDGDATFATYWPTAHQLLGLPNAGRRCYLVQDFEPWFYPMGSAYLQAEQTYRLGLHCITLGPWLARLLRQNYGATAHHFDFAVDTKIYWPQPLPRPGSPRVTFYARPNTARRGYELGVEALRLVKERYPEAEIVFFGASEVPPPSFMINLVGVRNPWELATLYSTTDVGLVISLTNPSFVPFEMMACKCPVVDVRSDRVEGLLTDRETALLAEPTPAAIADRVLELLWDKELRNAIAERGYEHVRTLSWQASARQIEQILLDHAPPPAERVLTRRAGGSDADSLLWQIHQVLDGHQQTQREIAQLETLLRHTLAEKAHLAQRLRQVEQNAAAATNRNMGELLRRTSTQALMQTPVWRLEQQRLSKLPLGTTPIQQHFVATASQLCGVELLLAPDPPVAGRVIRWQLHDLTHPEQPLWEQAVDTVTIVVDQPYRVEFPPQPYANGRSYRLTLVADGEAALHLWRSWTAPQPQAPLHQNGQPIRGQLVFQLHYVTPTAPTTTPPPAAWGQQPVAVTTIARHASQHAGQEVVRLTNQVGQVLRSRGPLALLGEIWQYIRWRFKIFVD